MVQATQVLQDAVQRQQSVYEDAEAAAQLFVSNAGELYPVDGAVQEVINSTDVGISDPRLAARTISHLVEDVADPVTAVPTDSGLHVGVVDYTAQDFYYESTQFHDIHGESTKAVCAQCVDEATFDHQASTYPNRSQYRRQLTTDHVSEGVGSVPHGSAAQERRTALGSHFLDSHTNLTAYEVAGASPTPRDDVLSGVGPSTDVPDQARVNMNHTPGDVIEQSGVTFDHVKQSFDLGIGEITVGATLVSGTTIGGNTALHGGNLSNFNVEAFGTGSTTTGEVPVSQGNGTLSMQAQTDTRTDVSQAGSTVVSDVLDINFTSGSGVGASVADDGDGSITASFPLDEAYSPSWTSQHDWERPSPSSGINYFQRLVNSSDNSDALWGVDSNGNITLTSSNGTTNTIYTFPPGGSYIEYTEEVRMAGGATINSNTPVTGGNQSNFDVENFATASTTSGEVPTAQGDGTLAMQSPGGGGGTFTEDANSPLTLNSTNTGTITLDGTYDVVRMVGITDNSSATGTRFDLRVNGNSDIYDTVFKNGNASSDGFAKGFFNTGFAQGHVAYLSGDWDNHFSVGATNGGGPCNQTTLDTSCNTTVTAPLDSITLFDDAANNATVTYIVEGIPV